MFRSELALFEENYALLCNTITDVIDPLMKCFVEETLIATEEQKQIADITAASEKLRKLFVNISHSLKADNTRGFYMMLKIMKEHGGKGTQVLADLIMNRLKISADELLRICSDDIHVQNHELKG